MKKKGFTLIELLVGLIIIFILTTISFRLVRQVRQKVKISVAKSQIAHLSIAVEMVKSDAEYYPPQRDDLSLRDLLEKTAPSSLLRDGWYGPYLSSLPLDPWGKDYFYVVQKGLSFGPSELSRSECGPPHGKTFNFSAVPGTATLVIENVCEIFSVSAGKIWLNGVEIVSPNEFQKDILRIEKDVTLLSENSLKVKLESKPGSYIVLSIFSFFSKQTSYILGSYGADKEGGGTGFNADIVWDEGGFS